MKSWLLTIETAVLVMVGLRVLSGLIELTAAGMMLRFNNVEKAVGINAILAIIGPTVLVTSIAVGLIGISDRISMTKLALIGGGVILILLGIRR
ncbi:YqhV family protein [Bacillus solitudinis]|uniref:YqhV family protein n=1 Tax=Bacillus solitudinis TaxID=2014074 RepID=UPI000C23A244|nr:YqhV family protein [Bacillus solitudinis]